MKSGKKKDDNKKKMKYKYINHEYDNIKSIYKNDNELMNRINKENKKRKKRINNMRKEQENEDYDSCTFKPYLNKKYNLYYINFNKNNNNYNVNINKEMTYVDFYKKKRL